MNPVATSEQLVLPRARTRVPHRLGQCALASSSSEDARKLLHGIGLAVRGMSRDRSSISIVCPNEVPSIDESMDTFVVTAVLLRPTRWSERPTLLADRDSVDNPQFLASVYAANEVEDRAGERVKQIAARTFLLPPAQEFEVERRAEIAEISGASVPLSGEHPFSLTRHLERSEIQRLRRMTVENQLAAITVLAARGRPAAFLSPRGLWPTARLISELGARLGCRIHRFSREEIPQPILSSLRTNRYLPTGEGQADPSRDARSGLRDRRTR